MSGTSTKTRIVAIRIRNETYELAQEQSKRAGQGISTYLAPLVEDAIEQADASELERASIRETFKAKTSPRLAATIVDNAPS